jgi:hypothetical protein
MYTVKKNTLDFLTKNSTQVNGQVTDAENWKLSEERRLGSRLLEHC